jgi:hypothetical protein
MTWHLLVDNTSNTEVKKDSSNNGGLNTTVAMIALHQFVSTVFTLFNDVPIANST